MPILLVPSNYEEGVTKVVKVGDVEGKGTEGVLVETTMGEVRLFPPYPKFINCDPGPVYTR